VLQEADGRGHHLLTFRCRRAAFPGTIWGPHAVRETEQSAGRGMQCYWVWRLLTSKNLHSPVLGVKGSRVQIPPSRRRRGFFEYRYLKASLKGSQSPHETVIARSSDAAHQPSSTRPFCRSVRPAKLASQGLHRRGHGLTQTRLRARPSPSTDSHRRRHPAGLSSVTGRCLSRANPGSRRRLSTCAATTRWSAPACW
jgi:hypothetical protein